MRHLNSVLVTVFGFGLVVSSAAHAHLGPSEWSGWPATATSTYSDVKAFLRQQVAQNPSRARSVSLGVSDSGEAIEGIRVGDGPVHAMVVATHHGNEYGSTEVAKAFAAAIAQDPIQGLSVTVIPVLNISGYNRRSRWEGAGGRTFDPNRDYPGPCGGEGPHALKSTRLLAEYVERENVVTSATLHTFYPAVVYPWGFGTPDLSTPYDDLYKQLTQAAVVESRYPIGNSAEAIYPANGTYEDYAFWKHGIWSLLFELGTSHSPTETSIQEMVRVNVPGLRRFLAQAPRERAENHAFTGRCDRRLISLDRHDE